MGLQEQGWVLRVDLRQGNRRNGSWTSLGWSPPGVDWWWGLPGLDPELSWAPRHSRYCGYPGIAASPWTAQHCGGAGGTLTLQRCCGSPRSHPQPLVPGVNSAQKVFAEHRLPPHKPAFMWSKSGEVVPPPLLPASPPRPN